MSLTLSLRAHRALCALRLHLWGRARRKLGVAGRQVTCMSCGQVKTLPVQSAADAVHAAKVVTRRPMYPPRPAPEGERPVHGITSLVE